MNLLNIIILLQMALGLLTATQNLPNASEELKKNAVNFANQAVELAIKELKNVSVLSPSNLGVSIPSEIPIVASMPAINTSITTIRPFIEISNKGVLNKTARRIEIHEAQVIIHFMGSSTPVDIIHGVSGKLLFSPQTMGDKIQQIDVGFLGNQNKYIDILPDQEVAEILKFNGPLYSWELVEITYRDGDGWVKKAGPGLHYSE